MPTFKLVVRAYKDQLKGGEVFDPNDARLTALSASVEPQGPVPPNADLTIKWIANNIVASETRLLGDQIAGSHQYDNLPLPGKFRVELWVNGPAPSSAIEFTVKNF